MKGVICYDNCCKKGNMFKVNGYGNKFVHAGSTAGEDDVFINTTDGVDYSSYVDLI